jgi:hypothetical protein
MSLFDFLKPKWTAVNMGDDDRARQFWLLKRRTSVSAWQRCREGYAAYVDLLERQCKEEPVGRMSEKALAREKLAYQQLVTDGVVDSFDMGQIENWDSNITRWTSATYANALGGLALYDKGLALLKQGDRSVFQHTSRGLLEDAYNRAHREYVDVYLGGPKGDQSLVFYGKYVPAMKAALQWSAEQVGLAAGGIQCAMANMSAPAIWQETREVYDPFEKRKKQVIGTSEIWKREAFHLRELPRVPQPVNEVFVRTGEACPAFGIYEAQVKDGLMVYMCEGAEALRYGEPCSHPGGGQPVTWRLIWEDQRYLDGVIPPEEADYFPDVISPPDFSHFVGEELEDDWRSDDLIVLRSGEPATRTGRWAARDDLGGRVYWRKGDALPLNKGSPTDWVYAGV